MLKNSDGRGPRRVAVAGLGAIGMRVAAALDFGIPGLRLAAVAVRCPERSAPRLARLAGRPRLTRLEDLAVEAEVIVECLPPGAFRDVAAPALGAGRTLIAASAGALLEAEDLIALARESGARILIPSGALSGIDGLRAGAEAGLQAVTLVTRKPPAAFGSALPPSVADKAGAATCLFRGSARQAVRAFPKNINVAATVSLAGLGPDATEVELWADPAIAENRHELRLRAASGEITTTTVNLPDPDNPGSSILTAHSIVALLRRLVAPLSVGS